jgi:hypothetical protein
MMGAKQSQPCWPWVDVGKVWACLGIKETSGAESTHHAEGGKQKIEIIKKKKHCAYIS